MRNKTLARIASIQATYQMELIEHKDLQDSIDDITHLNNQHSKKNKFFEQNLSFFYDLSKFVYNNKKQIQNIISDNIDKNWSMSSLHCTLLCILQTAIAELIEYRDTPTKVIINEYTNIGSEMLTDKEANFVNAILDNIAKTIRPDI